MMGPLICLLAAASIVGLWMLLAPHCPTDDGHDQDHESGAIDIDF